MKKYIALLLVALMLLAPIHSLAEDTGVKIIAGPEEEAEVVNMDDMQIGQTISIPGFGDVTIESFEFADRIQHTDRYINNDYYFVSGPEAEYARLYINILNTQHSSVNFKMLFGEIVGYYDYTYEFGGWLRERCYQDGKLLPYEFDSDSTEIGQLYKGYYMVAVTLPNSVVESREPLSITFTIGDNEFTYNVRK